MHDSCNVILDISSAQVKWRLSLAGVMIKELTLGAGINLVGGGILGECIITMTPADQVAVNISPLLYNHECQVILASGLVTDQFAGTFKVKPSLFKP